MNKGNYKTKQKKNLDKGFIKDSNKSSGKTGNNDEKLARCFKYGFIVFISLVIIAAALAAFFIHSESYVAYAGKEKITTAEFKFFLNQEKSYMLDLVGIEKGASEEKTFWDTELNEGEKAIDVAKKKALESARELRVQVVKANEQGIKLEKSEIDRLGQTIARYYDGESGGKAEADKRSLRDNGVKIDELKKIYKDIMLVQKLYAKETEAMKITEEEIRKYYDENKQLFEKATVRHILVASKEDDAEESKKEAEKKAEEILGKVNAGEDFEALAKQYSEDPGSKDNGGEYTILRNGRMVKEFEDWVFEHNAGDTGIVKTTYGYHVMKLEKKSSFEEDKEEVRSAIKNKRYNELLKGWKDEARFKLETNQAVYAGVK